MTASQDQQRMQLLPLVARHARDNRKVIHPHGTHAVTIIPVLPSAGIGSEVYKAVESGRRGIGVELKPSYWRTAVTNLREADDQRAIPTLFGEVS